MGKLSRMGATPRQRSPIQTTEERARTFEGALGHVRDAKSELFVLGAANFVTEDTFYEGAGERDARFRALVHKVAAEDPAWVAGFARYLRTELNMRSASLVLAAETVAAKMPGARGVVSSVLVRPDEPGAILGYWLGTYGRPIKIAMDRGIIDALPRLFTERNSIKYDGKGQTFRFGDVIELVRPKPKDDYQAILYRYFVDAAHGNANEIPDTLETLKADAKLWSLTPAERESQAAEPTELQEWLTLAGFTWERYASWIGRPLNAEDWAALVPNMGLMAIVRNLRNMDSAGISEETAAQITAKLGNVEDVKRSRQLPFRYYTAWREVQGMRWGPALEQALNLSLENVPELHGRTLIMIDHSGSMSSGYITARSTVQPRELADVFGIALAVRADKADVFVYDNNAVQVDVRPGASVLRMIERLPHLGGGTQTLNLLARLYNGQDRVVIVTDEQAFDPNRTAWYGYDDRYRRTQNGDPIDAITVPIYTFNIGGYRVAQFSSENNRHTFAGLSDSSFTILKALESGKNGQWPWEG